MGLEVTCPYCQKQVVPVRGNRGRLGLPPLMGVLFAVLGGIIGTSFGIATAGFGLAATIPLAGIGFIIGAGAGYLLGDKTVDKPHCPKCRSVLPSP